MWGWLWKRNESGLALPLWIVHSETHSSGVASHIACISDRSNDSCKSLKDEHIIRTPASTRLCLLKIFSLFFHYTNDKKENKTFESNNIRDRHSDYSLGLWNSSGDWDISMREHVWSASVKNTFVGFCFLFVVDNRIKQNQHPNKTHLEPFHQNHQHQFA